MSCPPMGPKSKCWSCAKLHEAPLRSIPLTCTSSAESLQTPFSSIISLGHEFEKSSTEIPPQLHLLWAPPQPRPPWHPHCSLRAAICFPTYFQLRPSQAWSISSEQHVLAERRLPHHTHARGKDSKGRRGERIARFSLGFLSENFLFHPAQLADCGHLG